MDKKKQTKKNKQTKNNSHSAHIVVFRGFANNGDIMYQFLFSHALSFNTEAYSKGLVMVMPP